MSSPDSSANLANHLRRLPPKWALLILAIVLAYWLIQPHLQTTFGWNLPSLASLLREPKPNASSQAETEVLPEFKSHPVEKESAASSSITKTRSDSVSTESASTHSSASESSHASGGFSQTKPLSPAKKNIPTAPNSAANSSSKKTSLNSDPTSSLQSKSASSQSDTSAAAPSKSDSDSNRPPSEVRPANVNDLARRAGVTGESDMTFGYLKAVGGDRFQSPAGLIYGRGSEEGHRLKHLAKHLVDQPSRPGSHGVFDGDMPQVLRWIDEAYKKAKNGDRMAKTRRDEEATIYEFTFSKPIGFVGGSDGRRRKNPSSQRLRIVVNGQNIITAFPF